MAHRVSKIIIGLVLVNEFDAIEETTPIPFGNDADGTAAEKVAAWLEDLPAHLAALEQSR